MRPEICGDYFKMISFTYSFMTSQYGMIISRGKKNFFFTSENIEGEKKGYFIHMFIEALKIMS